MKIMLTIRNPQQLLLVKQLYEDARLLAEREDNLSLSKALILLDLSVEQMLNHIILSLDPALTVNATKGSQDVDRRTLWGNAATALSKVRQAHLTETREMASLHALRNLVQHNGTEPSKSDVKRYLHAAGLMLTNSFNAAYGLDFEHFRLWDFISNISLRRWLEYSDDLLQQGEVLGCMVGCIVAHERVVDAVREHTKSQRFRSGRAHNLRDRRSNVLSRDDVNAIEKDMGAIRKDIYKEIDQLDNELVAIGVGLPIMDTRRFLQAAEPIILTDDEEDGLIISDERSRRERADGARNAAFMLDYLSRLVRLVEESYPGALKSVKLKMMKKGFWAK